MIKAGYLFSGQGQQFDDMGLDLYESHLEYRKLVDEASKILNKDFSKSVVLNDPNNCQLAIVIMSLGIQRILKSEGLNPVCEVGLSLGEYSALMAANAIDLPEGLNLLVDRSRYMAEAGVENPGTMVAVLNASETVIETALNEANEVGEVYPANYNTPKQTVFGGTVTGIERFSELLKAAGVKRVVPINIQVASHTPLMQPASQQMKLRLQDVEFHNPSVSVISNTLKSEFTDDNIREALALQLVRPTYFTDCLQKMMSFNPDCLIEIGPGKALSGFAKKTLTDLEIPLFNIYNNETLEKVLDYIRNQGD